MTLTAYRLDAIMRKQTRTISSLRAWPTCCSRPMSYLPDNHHYACPKCKRQVPRESPRLH